MHGIVFVELKKYVEERLGAAAWPELLQAAGLPGRVYLAVTTYEDADAFALVQAAAARTQKPADVILEDFGEFITPDLIGMYAALASPEWKTLEFLLNIEETIHRVVRRRNAGARPPEIRCERTGDDRVVIRYASARKMCALAKGLARGVATHFGEQVTLTESACLNTGAPECVIEVRLLPPVA